MLLEEITSVFIRFEKENKKGQATSIAPLNRNTLALFPTWGIQQELVVKDLPAAKLHNNFCFAVLIFKICEP